MTRCPATHNDPGFTRTAQGRMFPVVFRASNRTLPGSCRDIAWNFQRIAHRMGDGHAADDRAEFPAEGRRAISGAFAGKWPEYRRT